MNREKHQRFTQSREKTHFDVCMNGIRVVTGKTPMGIFFFLYIRKYGSSVFQALEVHLHVSST